MRPRGATQAQNHPKRGSSTKVEPIRNLRAIHAIEARLRCTNPRDYCLFRFGINTAYRASELLSLRVGQVAHLRVGDLLDIKQAKTDEYRAVTINQAAYEALKTWLAVHPRANDPQAPLFPSPQGKAAICVETLDRNVKRWCREVGLFGHFGSHSLRKTWGYHRRKRDRGSMPLLMQAFGHASEAQTLAYLGIQKEELAALYLAVNL